VCIHAEDVAVTRESGQTSSGQISSARNRLAGRVRGVSMEGALARVEMDCGFPLVAMVTAQSASEMGLREGDNVRAVVKATAVHLAAGGR
jgi:molybdopterin-binding protein